LPFSQAIRSIPAHRWGSWDRPATRNSACHTHFGISWPCDTTEWAVRRGEIWPWKYLDAWRDGQQLSPVAEIAATEAEHPDACSLAASATSAADA
jgi:hypothetical protein